MKWKLRAAEKDKKALKEEKDILEKVCGFFSVPYLKTAVF